MQYIHLRNKTYHFCFVVPQRFRHLYPHKEIKRSLRTDSYSIAVSRLANHFPVIHQINQLIAPCDHVTQLINQLRQCELNSVITSNSAVYELTASLQRSLPIPPAITPKPYLLEDAWADFVEWKSWSVKVESGAKRYFEFIKCCLGKANFYLLYVDAISLAPRFNF
ncbi:DUF6538 domain-containing protein [Shewanella electrodiphila]|uniref:DUF6538 domain-containing protein n=1 Tax=Shewanella electrodiphila TaxID=934143 RepID=UPI003D161670